MMQALGPAIPERDEILGGFGCNLKTRRVSVVEVLAAVRTRLDVAADIGRLYMSRESYKQIADALALTDAQVHNILSELFAEGMPTLKRDALTDWQARAIYATYLKGEGFLKELAARIGGRGSKTVAQAAPSKRTQVTSVGLYGG